MKKEQTANELVLNKSEYITYYTKDKQIMIKHKDGQRFVPLQVLREWEEVTRKAREYFAYNSLSEDKKMYAKRKKGIDTKIKEAKNKRHKNIQRYSSGIRYL